VSAWEWNREEEKKRRNENKQKQNKTNKNNNKQQQNTNKKNNFHPNSEIPNSMPAPYTNLRELDGEPKYECVREEQERGTKTGNGERKQQKKYNKETTKRKDRQEHTNTDRAYLTEVPR
jgi:hypothetical protein